MNHTQWLELIGQVVAVVLSYFTGHYVGKNKNNSGDKK